MAQKVSLVHPVLLVTTAIGATGVIALRMREARRPVTLTKIVLPPIAMSSGFLMFLYPPARIPLLWAVAAVILGAVVFAWPLIRTSRLVVAGEDIFVERSKAFLGILVVLIGVRFALRSYIEQYVALLQTGALFFLLAFGMVARWRLQMLGEFKRLKAEMALAPTQR